MMIYLAEAYLHTADPFAIEFPASWPLGGIRWYGVAYLAGFVVAWLLVRGLAVAHRTAIPVRAVADLMIYILVGVLIGGRLGYCIFYDPRLLADFTSDFPFWGVLAIHKGGMASHGGMLGVIIACWIFAVRSHISKLHLFDVVALVCPPGLFFGRLANFINAELWGKALPENMQGNPPWWSVKYPQEILESDFANRGGLEGLRSVVSGGDLFYANVVRAAGEGNQQVIETVQPLLTAYYPSQIIQAVTDGPILMAVLVLSWWGPRTHRVRPPARRWRGRSRHAARGPDARAAVERPDGHHRRGGAGHLRAPRGGADRGARTDGPEIVRFIRSRIGSFAVEAAHGVEAVGGGRRVRAVGAGMRTGRSGGVDPGP
ncbi:MAG: prolipoprotein diacylglyceryl transferase, partial [Planctomycetota bacterium]